MENVMKKVGKASSFLTKYIGIIIICFSVIAFFWRDGFAWTTNYTSIFLGVAMFGMGIMPADASSDRSCTRRYSGRMLSWGNSK